MRASKQFISILLVSFLIGCEPTVRVGIRTLEWWESRLLHPENRAATTQPIQPISATRPADRKPYITVMQLVPSLEGNGFSPIDYDASVRQWSEVVGTRIGDAVLVVGHGTMASGEWCVVPHTGSEVIVPPIPVAWIVKLIRATDERPIVLIVCNPAHVKLETGNVYYAPDDVLMTPYQFDEVSGDLSEFKHAGK